ncbi:glutathione hydrolase 1 proenzyme-like isoform X2 [Rhopilema esculentum]|eukprot:gene15623-6906_t
MKKIFVVGAVVVIAVIVIAVTLGVVLSKKDDDEKVKVSHPDNEAYKYSKAAVATDSEICSQVGSDILKKKGSAVDSAVASLFCTGVVNLHSTGLGGGGFLVYYNRQSKTSEVYNFRETAPAASSERMFLQKNMSSTTGGTAVAVPGEVKGLYELWTKYGKLKWAELIDPSIKLARDGFPLPVPVFESMKASESKIRNDPGLSKILLVNGKFKNIGDELKNPELAATLEKIKNNPHDFYNGSLAKDVVQEVAAKNGIITEADLKSYKVSVKSTISFDFDNMKMHTMPAPGSGAVLAMVINIMHGFNISAKDLEDTAKAVQVYHKIVESFKWSYARRALLGDPDFVPAENITRAYNQMLNSTIGYLIRTNKIKSDRTFNSSYYGGYYGKDDFGTSHVSILAENGDAVSATGTINYLFGGGYRGLKTGIIYNNEMDDFSTPGKANLYGYPPTAANYIRPGKRPLSSMCPAIITDKNGDVKMVAGASGGSRIITGTAQVIMSKLLFGVKLGPAVADPRLHHQLVPNNIFLNSNEKYKLAKGIVDGLKKLGHKVEEKGSKSVVQAIYREDASTIYAMSDPRKKGVPAGY